MMPCPDVGLSRKLLDTAQGLKAVTGDRQLLADGCLFSLLPVLFGDRVRATVEGAVRSAPTDSGLEELSL